jgi:TetR/AcrR family transcriptional regulator of autoinduction and epiphytic fitness
VAITAGLPSLDLARDMTECRGDREEGIARWIRAAATDGRLTALTPPSPPPSWNAWSRASPSGRNSPWANPRWARPRQKAVAEGAVEMFLARYGSRTG